MNVWIFQSLTHLVFQSLWGVNSSLFVLLKTHQYSFAQKIWWTKKCISVFYVYSLLFSFNFVLNFGVFLQTLWICFCFFHHPLFFVLLSIHLSDSLLSVCQYRFFLLVYYFAPVDSLSLFRIGIHSDRCISV